MIIDVELWDEEVVETRYYHTGTRLGSYPHRDRKSVV